MPYILILVGTSILYLDYQGLGNLLAAGALLRSEFFSYSPPFYKWLGALVLIALIGYVEELRPIATALLILVILSIILTKNRPSVTTAIVGAL